MKTALSFDDVLLVPQHNEMASRKDPDTSTKLSKHVSIKIPIISSCMDTVTGPEMAIAMWKAGGLGILHRYNTIPMQIEMFKQVVSSTDLYSCAVAVGATGDYLERTAQLVDHGATIICIDVAHGDSLLVEDAVKNIRRLYPNLTIIAGNVATGNGCARLIDAGADAIRVGVGGGSVCTTRLMTAHGVPTLQSILDCYDYLWYRHYTDFCLIADGGIKNSGDVVKGLAAGANAIILGQLLAATDESPGELIETATGKYKTYRGMASFDAQVEWRPEKRNEIVAEGETTILSYKGNVNDILKNLVGGLRSGMTYSNARTISDLKKNAEFVKITSAGWTESKPHAKVG